jgi:tetratricopeptide (TPR) repeat protein
VPLRPALDIDRAFELVVSQAPRSVGVPSRLDSLFADLRRAEPAKNPNETMELIWAIWIDHRNAEASHRMIAAVEAIAAGARDLARPILDGLIEDFPDWAEAWNKRATLSFIERRDEESIEDIERTLELEPRHFGAILGFAQICLRHGLTQEAKAAFETALALNPHIAGLHDVVRDLAATNRTLH